MKALRLIHHEISSDIGYGLWRRSWIILAVSTPATVAVQRETRTIPIVFAPVSDPVASGIVPRLNQPGGNITGFANWEASLGGKWLELLSEIVPGLKRAGCGT
jgi:putative ABC transport system substrate-binding protein